MFPVKAGIHQGTVLGPLSILLYIVNFLRRPTMTVVFDHRNITLTNGQNQIFSNDFHRSQIKIRILQY